jgi:hypothetical protein
MAVKSRRELLKLFGVGALAVPLVGGAPEMEAPVKLIEIPAIAPAAVQILSPGADVFGGREPLLMTVSFQDVERRICVMKCRSFVTSWRVETMNVTAITSAYDSFLPGLRSAEWELKGIMVGQATLL